MKLNATQRRIMERVINAFETGSADGDYGAISIHRDGPDGIRQLTYGRSQTTEYGKLPLLVQRYVDARGMYSRDLERYAGDAVWVPVTDDLAFRFLLRRAGRNDPVMRKIQDEFFNEEFFLPAVQWAWLYSFELPLSGLVIYDSFIHSGTVPREIRGMFPEPVPGNGGNERAWVRAYVQARHKWLARHPRAVLRKTTYRTQCLLHEIARDNWNLTTLPIRANGVKVAA